MQGYYQKRPVIVEAYQFLAHDIGTVCAWVESVIQTGDALRAYTGGKYILDTPEGPEWVSIGDWIICSPDGEFSVCPQGIFEALYEWRPNVPSVFPRPWKGTGLKARQ